MKPQKLETDLTSATEELLSRFSLNLSRDTLSHALLFHGLDLRKSDEFLRYLSAMILCHDPKIKPCQRCQSCLLLIQNGHPDLIEVKPEKKASAIKIEAIRDLNSQIFLSPQLGLRRVVIIDRADKMNIAAGNALLKLLEEPPQNVHFILQASHLSTILPTVLSRCQVWRVAEASANYGELSYFLGVTPVDSSDLAKIIENLPKILSDIETVLTQKTQICTIAAKWLEFDLHALITVLYWINASLIRCLISQSNEIALNVTSGTPMISLNTLLPHLSLTNLFHQIDKINSILIQLNQNIAINALLTIENFLLGYVSFTNRN